MEWRGEEWRGEGFSGWAIGECVRVVPWVPEGPGTGFKQSRGAPNTSCQPRDPIEPGGVREYCTHCARWPALLPVRFTF